MSSLLLHNVHTLVIRPCMMRKVGLLTLSCTDWNRSATRLQQVTKRQGHVLATSLRWPARYVTVMHAASLHALRAPAVRRMQG